MGSTQTKCDCGKFSNIRVVATCPADQDPNNIHDLRSFSGLDKIAAASDYRRWSMTLAGKGRIKKFQAYPCYACADAIGDKFDGQEVFEYEMTESLKGWWHTDLP